MSDVKDLPKKLPPTESEFFIDVRGETTGQQFKGSFTCKIPNLRDQALISKHRAYLNGDLVAYLDAPTLRLHQMISYLRYTLVTAPTFWKESDQGYELMDQNVIEEIYNKTLEFEEEWMQTIWGKDKIDDLKKKQNE